MVGGVRFRYLTAARTSTGLDPPPGSFAHDTVDPYFNVVPYSNLHAVTGPRLGLTSRSASPSSGRFRWLPGL